MFMSFFLENHISAKSFGYYYKPSRAWLTQMPSGKWNLTLCYCLLRSILLFEQLLFAKATTLDVLLIEIKIVDDILASGTDAELRKFVTEFEKPFFIGSDLSWSGNLQFFGLSILPNEDVTCSLDRDDKLLSLSPEPLTRIRRRQ